jgi:hypothetical protein
MSGSNDIATRRQVYSWIAAHERTFYAPRTTMNPVGVYFSPTSRNYFTKDFLSSYQGVIILLLQHHLEYQVVTPRTLNKFRGGTLVVPDVRVVAEDEKNSFSDYVKQGGKLVVTGNNATGLIGGENITLLPDCPGKAHLAAISKDMLAVDQKTEQAFLSAIQAKRTLEVDAPPLVATQIATVDGKPHVFLFNSSGLVPKKNARQTPASNVKLRMETAGSPRVMFLPFLGEPENIVGQRAGNTLVFTLPNIDKAAVAWVEATKQR